MSRTIILARHGQTAANVDKRLDTALPGDPLTEEGWHQAAELADALADPDSPVRQAAGGPVAALYHSAATRARDTASVIAKRLELDPTEVDDVHEVFAGDLEGLSDEVSIERYRDVTRLWYRGELDQPLPGGESGRQVLDRYLPVLDRILAAHPDEVVLLVSHAASIRIASHALARNLDEEFVTTHYLQNCSPVVLAEDDEGWRCVRWHDVDVP